MFVKKKNHYRKFCHRLAEIEGHSFEETFPVFVHSRNRSTIFVQIYILENMTVEMKKFV